MKLYRYTCSICLEKLAFPCKLKLNCNCKYTVHKKCYLKWWEDNQNCIICLKPCEKPYSKKTFIQKRLERIRTRLRIRYRNNTTNFSTYDMDNINQEFVYYNERNYALVYFFVFKFVFSLLISIYMLFIVKKILF